MRGREKHEPIHLTILDAVETLSSIADLEGEPKVEPFGAREIEFEGHKVIYHPAEWLEGQDPDTTVHVVREIFRVVLSYLRGFYRKEHGYLMDPKTVRGIETIMVLVGEAAKKLDKYTHLFRNAGIGSVTNLKEYKRLQDFYRKKIERRVDEKVLGRWLLGLTREMVAREKREAEKAEEETVQIKHIFVDLETVKKDTEYELFFLRKEDGSRFFNPRLIRNIKLVCDFGGYLGEEVVENPLIEIREWQSRMLQVCADDILRTVGGYLNNFYEETLTIKNREFVGLLKKTLMALMLSANPRNLLREGMAKNCEDYFLDFQNFLREILCCREYQKLVAYPPKRDNVLAITLLELVHALCQALFLNLRGMLELKGWLESFIQKARRLVARGWQIEGLEKISQLLCHEIDEDYSAASKLIKWHPNGPLMKVLDLLSEGIRSVAFDPLLQRNLPGYCYDVFLGSHQLRHIRMPCPVRQEFIHKAAIVDEFKGFLRAYAADFAKKGHLVFNLQDRTSWREHCRSTTIEELQKQAGFKKAVTVVTLAVDTDFYHQHAPYYDLNDAKMFKQHLKEHLSDESSGFFFPPRLKKVLFKEFVDQALEQIHHVFFGGKKVLPREHRLDFIEIFYLFLELKILEIVSPNSFSFSCKDGIDLGPAASAKLFVFLKMLESEKWTAEEWQYLSLILHGPALSLRERLILPEPFHRMLGALEVIERLQNQLGEGKFPKHIFKNFQALYRTSFLDMKVGHIVGVEVPLPKAA